MITIDIENRKEGLVVHLAGEGQLASSRTLQESLRPILDVTPKLVVLALAQVTFASSLFMGSLVQFRGLVKQQGGQVKMCCLQEPVATSFEMARLDWIIPTFATLEEALAA